MSYNSVSVTVEEEVALVFVDRPEKLNALNRETIKELGEALGVLEEDPKVRAIILTGSGPKAFVAGADIAEFSEYSESEGRALAADGQRQLFDRIETLRTPVIAAVNGFALGGGLELAMACHFRVASTNAKMGLARGFPGSNSGVWRNPTPSHARGKREGDGNDPHRGYD